MTPSRDKFRAFVLPAALVAGLVAVGCGARGNHSDLVNGKTLFTQKCGACHTLARANTKGIQGPNLDAAFTSMRSQGFGQSGIRGVVLDQISHVRRGSIMPRNLVKGDDARDVAGYVAFAAAVPGKDSGALASAGQPKTSNKTATEQNGTLTIPADPTGALAYVTDKASAKPGTVKFVMPNKSPIQHNIAIKGPASGNGPIVGSGGTSRFTATLKPGTYMFFCQVPGHEAAGMKGTLTVK